MDMEMETNSHRLVASRGRLLLADLLVCLAQIELPYNEKDKLALSHNEKVDKIL